jgi:hypothetical protein
VGKYDTITYSDLTFLVFGDGQVSTLKLMSLKFDEDAQAFHVILDGGLTQTFLPLD